MLSRYTSPLQ
ncbi:unnamed protein product, partial [Rotaria sp. Silwood1]